MLLNENKELFVETIRRCSEETDFTVEQIEKDYYVTMMLKSIVANVPEMVFRGGTSLSKCYKVIKRFSEDVDLSSDVGEENAGKGVRKRLVQGVRDAGSSLNLEFTNPEDIRSRRDFNQFVYRFESSFGSEDNTVIVESTFLVTAFPVERMYAASIIHDCLKENGNYAMIAEYGLEPFELLVQKKERTFIDKVFALCDYYIDGNITKHSRHLYDLYKLYPLIEFDDDFKNLLEKVRLLRRPREKCYSAHEGQNVGELLNRIIDESAYRDDYMTLTYQLLGEDVPYEETIENLRRIIGLGMF